MEHFLDEQEDIASLEPRDRMWVYKGNNKVSQIILILISFYYKQTHSQ